VIWKELLIFLMNTEETSGYLKFLRGIEPPVSIRGSSATIWNASSPTPTARKSSTNWEPSTKTFTAHGFHRVPFAVEFCWFNGAADIATYDLDELLGTKLRALYQSRKGHDLFDMATALSNGAVDPARIVAAFRRYMDEGGHAVTRADFEGNLAAKLEDKRFLSDIPPLLAAGQT
jgi:hypothetical protein